MSVHSCHFNKDISIKPNHNVYFKIILLISYEVLCKSIVKVHVSILIRHANVYVQFFITDLFNILFICIYMSCDLASNIDEFMYVLSNIEALRVKYHNHLQSRPDN